MLSNIRLNIKASDNTSHNVIFILMAKLISDFGAFLNMVALSAYIYYLSDSPFMVGIFLACRVLGGMLASILSNKLFRHLPGKKPLVGLDLIRATILIPLIFLPIEYHLIVIPFIGLILGGANSFFSIGLNSQLSQFVGQSKLGKTNAWITILSSIGMVIGALSSGLVIALLGYDVVFTLNIFSYLLAAIFISLLKELSAGDSSALDSKHTFRQDIALLIHALKQSPIISAMLIITLVDTLGSASHNVGFPIISKLLSPQDAAKTLGYIIATWAIGKLIGAFLSRVLGLISTVETALINKRRMEKGFILAVLTMSSSFIFAFNQDTLLLGLVFFFIAGVSDGISEVCFITRAQHTEDKIRLPLFSSIAFMQNTGFGLGMLVSAIAFEYFSAGTVVGFFHGIPILVATIAYLKVSKQPQ